DKDGTEKISNSIMIRRKDVTSVLWGLITVRYRKNARNKWGNAWSSDRSDAVPFTGVILPKGSILRLLGRSLTWEDEPVEIPCVIRATTTMMWESGETKLSPGPLFEVKQKVYVYSNTRPLGYGSVIESRKW